MAFEGNRKLAEVDEEILNLIKEEKNRQINGLELVASEVKFIDSNFTSAAVMEAIGTCFTNKYSEGLPGARYYGGNEVVDKLEILTQNRALEAFGLDPKEWGCNVQPYSGSPANFAVYTGVLRPHDRIMGLDLPSGGHLTHGYQTDTKKISATSIYFESMPYTVDDTGYIQYDQLEANAALFRPNMLIIGASAYPRDWDYERARKIADNHKAYLMCDMAHVSGLVLAKCLKSPFDFCDVVTTTTHKSLRGPRSAIIFFRRGQRVVQGKEIGEYDLEAKINFAVFPGCQGGPHENTIAGVAVALKEAMNPSFVKYSQDTVANCRIIGEELTKKGYKLVTGGTDNHLILWDLRPLGLTGNKVEKLFDLCCITVNKNAVYGDRSALAPGGIRIGAGAMTSRGLTGEDFVKVAEFLSRGVQLAVSIQEKTGKLMKDFVPALSGNEEIKKLGEDVNAFASTFKLPGL